MPLPGQSCSWTSPTASPRSGLVQQNHWTERERAASVYNSCVTARPRRSVLSLGLIVRPSTSTIGPVVVGLLACLVGCSRSGPSHLPPLLSAAALASLPSSATNIAYYDWTGIGTGNSYVRFELSPSDLHRFLSNSPALQNKQPTKRFDETHQHLSIPQASWSASLSQDNEYYLEGSPDPEWFRPTVVGKGQLFKIDFSRVTWILFDEDKHIVWLFTSRG